MYGYGYTNDTPTGGIGDGYPSGYGVIVDPLPQEDPVDVLSLQEPPQPLDERPFWVWASVATNFALSGLLLLMIYKWPRTPPPPGPPQSTRTTTLWEKINPMYAGS